MTHPPIRLSVLVLGLLISALGLKAATPLRIGLNFTSAKFGVDSAARPPDSNGAVGLNHFVQLINGQFRVFDKATGQILQSRTDRSFWTNAGIALPASLDVTDPRIVFDTEAQRWFACMIDVSVNSSRQRTNRFLIAVSQNADPTQTWQGAAFTADPSNGYFADFPTMGLDRNGVYLGADLFDRRGNPVGPVIISIPKAGLLASPIDISGRKSSGLLKYSERGDILQPVVTSGGASSEELALAVGDLGLDFLPHNTLVVSDIQNPAKGSSMGASVTIQVSPYTIPSNPLQPSGADNLDDGDTRISASVQRTGDLIYAVHGEETEGRAAIRWYQISTISKTVLQSGTIADPGLEFFYPSIAANEKGDVVIGFNGTGPNAFVSAYATVGQTISGVLTFGEPVLLMRGLSNYDDHDPSGTSRWGDYSATSVDPENPNRFWTVQEYPVDATTWATQVTEIILGLPALAIQKFGQDLQIKWPATIGAELQATVNFTPPQWTRIDAPFVPTNGVATYQLNGTNQTEFFRLVPASP